MRQQKTRAKRKRALSAAAGSTGRLRLPRPGLLCLFLSLGGLMSSHLMSSPLMAQQQLAAQKKDPYLMQRLFMVREYIERDGITNKRVLEAFRTVPRHEFVSPSTRKMAYYDTALPIGYRQTISPPFVVAYMTQTIDPQPEDKVLEIGTGSGYQAAILSQLVKKVYTIEIVAPLGKTAAKRLQRLGYSNVETRIGDGYQGWPEAAPFDKIIVTCSPEKVPQPLIDQLKDGGKMLIPLGERYQQVFYLFEKRNGKLSRKKLIPTLFVPMTGISEKNRKVKPDLTRPQVVNGSFENDENRDGRPDNWHYQRQVTLMAGNAPEGNRFVSIQNVEPGRRAQLLQGMAVDGRYVKKIVLEVTVRFEKTAYGPKSFHQPGVFLHFYDSIRKPVATAGFRPFVGTRLQWTTARLVIPVPPKAREAVLQVGLNGGTGRLDVDNVRIVPLR